MILGFGDEDEFFFSVAIYFVLVLFLGFGCFLVY